MNATSLDPPRPSPRRHPGFVWAVCLGTWTLLALAFLTQMQLYRFASGERSLGLNQILLSLLSNWLWGLFSPFILALVERFPLDRQGWRRDLGVHLFAAFGFSALDSVFGYGFSLLLETGVELSIGSRFTTSSFINVIGYMAVASVGYVLRHNRLLAERRLRESELESQLLQARLQALEMQLRPHFLFNALHTVSGLIRTRQYPEAVQMVVGLGDLLRSVLRAEGPQLVPLRQELAFIEKYLGIEQVRFQDRLRTRIDAAPEVLDARVPHLVLQPLVENAILHGIEAGEGAGEVEVSAREAGGWLWLEVRNTGAGPGAEVSPRPSHGIGLENTRERLGHLYGERHHFELVRAEGGGARARVGIPLQRQAVELRTSA